MIFKAPAALFNTSNNTKIPQDRYSAGVIGIITQLDKDSYFKRISDTDTLVVEGITTSNPQVSLVSRQIEFQSNVMMAATSTIRYKTSAVSTEQRVAFINEVQANLLSHSQLENSTSTSSELSGRAPR